MPRSRCPFPLAAVTVLALATSAAAQSRLGQVAPGGVLSVTLDEIIPLSRLVIEVDGDEIAPALQYENGKLLIDLPSGLSGTQHDLVVYRALPDRNEAIGAWRFETPSGATAFDITGEVEAGLRGSSGDSEGYSKAHGRLSFDTDQGRWRGGISFTGTQRSLTGETEIDATDYYLERRAALLGDDLYLRFGTHILPESGQLIDDNTRRGLTFRLADADYRYEAQVFALQTAVADGNSNLSGLTDPADRSVGATGFVYPIMGSNLRLGLAGYSAAIADLPSGRPGDGRGYGLSLAGPIADGRADFDISHDRSDWQATGGATRHDGTATRAEFNWQVSEPGDENSLSFGVIGSRVDPGYYSALNPDLIRDEQAVALTAQFYSPAWQWDAQARLARDNITAAPGATTDEYRDAYLDIYYIPDDFTGGFLNGTTFYAGLATEDQRRIKTPAGGPANQDFRLNSLNLGVDKFQQDYAWAISYALDQMTDLSGRRQDERRQTLELLYARTPDDLTTLTWRAELAERRTAAATLHGTTLEVGYEFDLIPDTWSTLIEAGANRTDWAPAKDGAYFGVELARHFDADREMVFSAAYGNGAESSDLAPQGGWVFGLALRHDFTHFSGQ